MKLAGKCVLTGCSAGEMGVSNADRCSWIRAPESPLSVLGRGTGLTFVQVFSCVTLGWLPGIPWAPRRSVTCLYGTCTSAKESLCIPFIVLDFEQMLWMSHPWEVLRPWAVWSGGSQPMAVIGTGGALRSLPAQPLCDSVILSSVICGFCLDQIKNVSTVVKTKIILCVAIWKW